MPGVIRAELCGSLRRRRETAKDIDIVASSDDAEPIMDAFVKLPEVMQVVGHGPTKSSIVAAMHVDGEKVVLNADLRVVTDEQFPFALAALHRQQGAQHPPAAAGHRPRLALNEYALAGETKTVPCQDRGGHLQGARPRLRAAGAARGHRRDRGGREEAAAEAGRDADIRGVFHNHTTASDGTATLEEMALAAKELGCEYFGVGDHSQSLTVANGLTPERCGSSGPRSTR